MTLWQRARQVATWVWVLALFLIGFLIWFFVDVFRERNRKSAAFDDDELLRHVDTAKEGLAIANATAAVKIAAARAGDSFVQQEIADIEREPDRTKRLVRLVEMRRRLEVVQ